MNDFTPFSEWPRWFRLLNTTLLALLIAALLAFVIVSFVVETPPYDYLLLTRGANWFCFDNEHFAFGLEQHNYYPAPFYTTFCLPHKYAEPILRWVWMLAPVLITIWLARGRAGALAYPPLGVLLLIGQSSWLLLPLFILAERQRDDRLVPWWYGLALGLSVLKPQVALVAWLWLVHRWRGQRRVLLMGALAMTLLALPSFLLRPGWVFDWLPNGRGFEPVNLASVAFIPVQLGQLGFDPGPVGLAIVWGFCLLVAFVVYRLLRSWRGQLEFYDWALLFFFVSPVANDYDLVVLLPSIASRPRRLLLVVTIGIVSWVFAMMTKRWSMSFMVTLVLLILRLWRVDDANEAVPQTEIRSVPTGG